VLTITPSPNWATDFHPFTAQHAASSLTCLALIAGACWLGRRWRRQGPPGHAKEHRLRAVWIITTVAWQAFAIVYWLLPANFRLEQSLPLHLCDLAAWVAPLALWLQARWLRSLLYFWGIGLSTQAFVTPVLEQGHADLRYWLFFIGHTQIVGSAIYDVAVLGFRPRLRDLAIGSAITLAWVAAITPLNIAFDLNYGYVGQHDPERPTIIQKLGPWPLRMLWLIIIGLSAFALIYAVWPLAGWIAAKAAQHGDHGGTRRKTRGREEG
jgi:hypothetical integral membrane protein (TIGR02206 family)